MLLRPLLAVAGLSAATHAVLLPPGISPHDAEVVEALPFETAALAQTQSLSLDCPGCPPVFKNHHGKPKHHKQHSSHLELEFSIDRSAGPAGADRLMLNGFELYPNSDPFTNLLIAPQVADKREHYKDHKPHDKHTNGGDGHKGDNSRVLPSHHKFRPGHHGKPKIVEQPLGFSLQIHPVQRSADDSLDLVLIDLQIIEVGSVFVEGLPNIRVNMIKSPQNDLLIAKIEQTASENLSSPQGDEAECTTTLCKLKAIIADKINKMKMHGCPGMMGGKAGHHPGHAQPASHHNEHYGMFNRPNGWSLFFRKVTSHIILPVLVGIVAGVTVAVLSMLVGTLLVGLFRKFVRGQSFFPQHRCRLHPGGRYHKAAQKEAAVDEEKSGLMENQEAPPSYDQAEVQHVERA